MKNGNGKAIIFDMDGTLIDSEPLHLKAYQKLLAHYGHTWSEEDNREFLGRTDKIVTQAIARLLDLSVSPEQLVEMKEEILMDFLKESAFPRPGVMKVLDVAREKAVAMGVASSATLPTIEFVVDALKIRSYFKTLTSGEEVEQSKPAPDVFLLAAERLGAKPHDCLVIEDTLNGIKAAKAAGMACVAVPCDATRHQNHSQADVVYESLEQFDVAGWLESGVL